MKKAILSLLAVILLTSCTQSQWFKGIKGNGNVINKTRNVGEYNQISVAGSFHVNLVSGTEGKLEIKIEDNLLEYLITEVVDGKLELTWEKDVNIRTKKGVYITVPFKDIDAITLAGSSDVTGNDTIKTDEFYTSVSGSGNMTLSVEANTIISEVESSGDVTIIGNTANLTTSITGSGGFHGFELDSENVNAKVTGSGDISVTVGNKLKARVIGSGNIEYAGNPETQDTKVTGSGNITAK